MVVIVTETRTCDDLLQTATAALGSASTFAGGSNGGSPGAKNAFAKVQSNQGGSSGGSGKHVVDPNNFVALGSGGSAGIHRINQCDYSAWFAPVTNTDRTRGRVQELEPGQTIYTPYWIGEGVSEKYATDSDIYSGGPVVQLEYKLGANEPNVMYYDLSFIDCGPTSDTYNGACAFKDGGYLIAFSQEGDSAGCPHIYCPHEDDADQLCRSAYYRYDDVETFSCVKKNFAQTTNTTVTFCPSDKQLEAWNVHSDSDDDDDGDDASEHSNY